MCSTAFFPIKLIIFNVHLEPKDENFEIAFIFWSPSFIMLCVLHFCLFLVSWRHTYFYLCKAICSNCSECHKISSIRNISQLIWFTKRKRMSSDYIRCFFYMIHKLSPVKNSINLHTILNFYSMKNLPYFKVLA